MDKKQQQNKKILMYIDPQWQIWQQAAPTTYHLPPTTYHLPPIISGLLWRKMFENVPEKVKRMDHQQKNDKTRRVRGLGRKTR